jgi:hypothetical protein
MGVMAMETPGAPVLALLLLVLLSDMAVLRAGPPAGGVHGGEAHDHAVCRIFRVGRFRLT